MKLVRAGDVLTVRCPAKVNLFLELHGRRPDGYHEIETVMQTITLYDELTLRPRSEPGIGLWCSDPALPVGAENLAWRAAERLARETGWPGGVEMELVKNILAGAGLGGGSSDAAGALAGVNTLFELGLDRDELAGLAAEVGSDVPFFLYGGTCLCRGRGEAVTEVPCVAPAHYVILCPDRRLATAEVYQNLARLGLTSGDRSARFILEFLAQGDLASACASRFNRLEAAAAALAPDVRRAQDALSQAASQAASVCGSGSSVYVMLETASEAADVRRRLHARGTGRAWVARTEPGGGP
jgi:4-diphosphocytidyl-2-C-methyl-D-erythritol kinase